LHSDFKSDYAMTPEQLDKIDRYINREMSDEEKRAFRSEVETDAELRKEFNLARLTVASIQRNPDHLEAFKKKFIEARPLDEVPVAAPIWKKTWFWAMIAAFAIIAALMFFIFQSPASPIVEEKEKILDDRTEVLNTEPEPIDNIELFLEIYDPAGDKFIQAQSGIVVFSDAAINVWHYEFDGITYLRLYAPAQPAYRTGQFERMVKWEDRYFLLIEKQWFEYTITEKGVRKELLPVDDPDFLNRILPK